MMLDPIETNWRIFLKTDYTTTAGIRPRCFCARFSLVHKKGGPETAVNAGIVDNSVDKVEKDRG
jgi:hypothetical protein